MSYTNGAVMEQELIFFEDNKGQVPFDKWIKKLKDRRAIAAILSTLNKVREGNFGDCKYLRSGVWELRIHFSRGYRIYFARHQRNLVVLLWGGDKSTQQKDIIRAVMYWHTFKEEIGI